MNKVLVLGATGLIGHQVCYHLKAAKHHQVVAMANIRKLDDDTIQVDARDEQVFVQKITEVAPDIIVNCMGVLIEEATRSPEQAIFLNAYMPHRLKRLANEIHAKLIHISTDCVFSGKNGAYVETDVKDADDTYGRTKALGEVLDEPHLTLRTSVIGPELKDGEELFHWFMKQEGHIHGYTKVLWSGVTTLELAKSIQWAIINNITGLYHVTNSSPINKYDLLVLIKKYMRKNITINEITGKEVNKSLIDTRKEINYIIPSYELMIEELVELIFSKKNLYKQYQIIHNNE